MIKRIPLQHNLTATDYFQKVRHLGYAILLDSGFPKCQRGRFDIISAAPLSRLSYKKGILGGDNLPFDALNIQDPFIGAKLLLEDAQQQLDGSKLGDKNNRDIPFCGGLLGHFNYDLGRCLEKLPSSASNDLTLPDMQLGLYAWAIILDHKLHIHYLVVSDLMTAENLENLLEVVNTPLLEKTNKFSLSEPFSSNLTAAQYRQSLEKIDHYILEGDCYQVNFAQRFQSECSGDPFTAYLSLREAAPTHFSAFIDTDDGAIISLSPERFLSVDRSGKVMTQPIKGTQPRSSDTQLDAANKAYLENSTKDHAENLMIVDLMRNDISKSCALHSVKVPALFAVESYQNVHHLVSTVTGQLETGLNALDLLRGCFPGGSITGAPKLRAMEIIEELEPHRRSIYCGSIGYISLCGAMDSSITIRTLLVEKNRIYCWAGGGIVADSMIDDEYQETFDKVNNLLDTLTRDFG